LRLKRSSSRKKFFPAGIKTVILPERNKKDLPEVPKEAQKGVKFIFAKNTNDVLKIALNES